MTDRVKLSEVCDCDPFDACYQADGAREICTCCGRPRPVLPVITADDACPRCQGTGRLLNGAECSACDGHGYLW